MKPVLIIAWLIVPILGILYHGGPGQEKMALDRASSHMQKADQLLNEREILAAESALKAAAAELPSGQEAAARRIRLNLAKIWLETSRLPDAWNELNLLLEEDWSEIGEESLHDDVRSTMAQARYYLTWLMRLEGRTRAEWEPEIESARQTYRYLAEKAETTGDEKSLVEDRENLESTILLARMDLDELQGLNLPSQCQGCCSGDCKGEGKRPDKKKGNSGEKDARGASSGPPPDNGGS